MAFPRLQELAAVQNSNSLTEAMSVYIERKINKDLHFAAGLSHLWESVIFDHFDSAIYWNDGLHWLETENSQLMHYNLNIEDHDHPIIATIPIPQRGMTFFKSYGYMDPMQILIQMSYLLHLEGKLFEWCGSLFLVCLDDFGSKEFTICEMTIGYSVWMVRYRVHIDDFMTPLLEGCSIRSNVWRIVLENGIRFVIWSKVNWKGVTLQPNIKDSP
ncbi:hypothetical protein Tco_0848292 [Tanacetum coccineum]